jgi:hypothetical protein
LVLGRPTSCGRFRLPRGAVAIFLQAIAWQFSCVETRDEPPRARDAVARLYSLDEIPTFEISLSEQALAALAIRPKEYVTASFRCGNQSIAHVGVRLKGNASLTTLNEKPSLKIKFLDFDKGSDFLGLEKLTLHAMHQDPTMVREYLGYLMFRTLGLPAPRAGYARVVINDVPYGLYLNLETPDRRFLVDRFASSEINLYEGDHGDDVDAPSFVWEQDEGSDRSRVDLEELREMAMRPTMDVFYGESSRLDRELVLGHFFAEAYSGHFDGYWSAHNFFLAHDLLRQKWSILPWSLDQTFVEQLDPFAGGGYLKKKCLADERCTIDFVHLSLQALQTIDRLDLVAQLDDVSRFIAAAAQADTRKQVSNEAMQWAQVGLRSWLGTRTREVRARIDCLDDGRDVDRDGDGFRACAQDCDDADPGRYPGALETCNGVDDDCNRSVDDAPACPCPSEEVQGVLFYFCRHEYDWFQAREFCRAQGRGLADFENAAQNDAVAAAAWAKRHSRWIMGINDIANENRYTCTDGSLPLFERWASGEPAHTLAWYDCGYFASDGSGAWEELNCLQIAPFVCR